MVADSPRPVVIVGAGPTGLIVAIELARRGVPFHLIDRSPEPAHWSRAIFIKSRTLEILAQLGLRDRFYERGQIVRQVDVYSNETRMASYRFDGLDTTFPHILSIPEEDTIRILTDRLESLAGRIERGVEFVALRAFENHVRTTLKCDERGEFELDASVVVGTDGDHSAVREAIADDFEGRDYPELWGVFDTQLRNWQHDRDTVCAQLAEPIAIPFPLGEARWRIYFRTAASDRDVLVRVLERLRVVAPDADLVNPAEPQFFRSHSRLARKFRIGRVFLAGDAAHTSNPIEGHGMNAGIQDAYNLGWKLAAMAAGHATDRLVASYEAERRPADRAVVQSGDEAYRRMMPSGATALRDLYAFLSTSDGQRFAALAESEIDLGYEQSPLVEEIGATTPSSPRTTRVGYRVGDVERLVCANRHCTLHDLLADPDPSVFLMVGAAPSTHVMQVLPELQAVTRDGGCQLHVVVHAATAPSTSWGEVLLDPRGHLHERLSAGGPSLCLVRPDGHLGFRCAPPSAQALSTHLGLGRQFGRH